MTVKQYLTLLNFDSHSNVNLTFVVAHARQDDNTPFYHTELTQTPTRRMCEWWFTGMMDMYILNIKHPYIGTWIGNYDRSNLVFEDKEMCLYVISLADMEKGINKKQAMETFEYRDKYIMESIKGNPWMQPVKPKRAIESIACKEQPKALEFIRETLLDGRAIEVHNQYETFYGVEFDAWLRKGIADIECDIEIISWNSHEDYPWTYRIKPCNIK